jgi:hypothetical protein
MNSHSTYKHTHIHTHTHLHVHDGAARAHVLLEAAHGRVVAQNRVVVVDLLAAAAAYHVIRISHDGTAPCSAPISRRPHDILSHRVVASSILPMNPTAFFAQV